MMDKPTYLQIYESLYEQIGSGYYRPGDRLPSERDLSQQLGVSRMTVRHALDSLVNRGMAYRRQGAGTFVARPKVEHQVDILVSFKDSMEQSGMRHNMKLLSLERMRANKKLANRLGINIGQLLCYIHRLRMHNGDPISLEHSYFPSSICPKIEQFDLEKRSIYKILENEFGIQIEIADQYFEPVVANKYESEMLSVSLNAPLMLVSRISYDVDGQAIEYGKDIYRGDMTRFVSRSPRHGSRE